MLAEHAEREGELRRPGGQSQAGARRVDQSERQAYERIGLGSNADAEAIRRRVSL